MLKHARLYKDANGQVWHIKSDGTAVKYPQFEEYSEAPKGAYEEILHANLWTSQELSDKLYLDDGEECALGLISTYDETESDVNYIFDVLSCMWVSLCGRIDLLLLDVVNLKKGTKYMVKGRPAIFQCYLKNCDSFLFSYDNTDDVEYIKVHQICDVKEVGKMPKMYEVWKEANGETKGRDCKTGREFPISENVFGYVERYSKEPKVGDIVYIHNAQGICPHEIFFVQTAAHDIPANHDDILLYYAYGLNPTPAHVETDKMRWTVEYTRKLDQRALIRGSKDGYENMRLVVNKDCLAICPH